MNKKILLELDNLGKDLCNHVGFGLVIGSLIDYLESLENKEDYILKNIDNLNQVLFDYTARYNDQI